MNMRSMSFKISFWSGLTLIVLGCVITFYAVSRMNAMAIDQQKADMDMAQQFLLNAAKQQAVHIKALVDDPLSVSRTLAQAFTSAAHKQYDDLTDDDHKRLQLRFRRMEIATDLAHSLIKPYIAAAASGQLSLAEAQRNAMSLVRQLRYDGDNYVWIQDTATPIPLMLMHPMRPELEGKVMDGPDYTTAMTTPHNFAVQLNEVCLKQGSGYIRYKWSKPGETTIIPKMSFGRLVPEWGWVLGSGMWLDVMSFYNRADLDSILRAVLEKNPNFLGVYTGWEPNAFDGLDKQFVNQPGSDATGRFLSYWNRSPNDGIRVEPLVDYDKPSAGDYYLLPKNTQTEQIINPYFYTVQGRKTLLTSLVTPIIVSGQFRGITGVDLTLDRFQPVIENSAKELYDGQAEATLIANNATIVASSHHADTVGQPIDALYRNDSENAAIRAAVTNGEELTLTTEKQLVVVTPVRFGYTKTPWAMLVAVPLELLSRHSEQAAESTRQAAWVMTLISIVAIILGVGFMLWVAAAIARHIQQVSVTLRNMATGEGDLTRQLDTSSGDELAELAASFNAFQQRIRDLILTIATSSERVAAASEELSMTSMSTNSQIHRQQSEMEQVGTAMNSMTATVSEVAHHAQNAAQAAIQADQEASAGRDIVLRAVQSIQDLSHRVETSTETIDRLSNDSSAIGKILDVIRDIADQTNLLALNAAIEAARAGEQGRGFAVVADEVRTLASRTQASTREIQQMIERLQTGAATAVTAMEEARTRAQSSVTMASEAGNSLDTIAASVTTIRDMNHQIASATERQTAVANEVDHNLNNSMQALNAVATSSAQINNAAIELAQLASEQQSHVNRFKV